MKRNTMHVFEAPKGFVYDYKEPKYSIIIDGETETQEQEHLYVNRLVLCSQDDIDNYILVADPKGE